MRPIIAEINRASLRHNWREIKRRAKKNVFAVVKANAYGCGVLEVARTLADSADGFALVELDDAIALRRSGINQPILLLSGFFHADELPAVVENRLWTAAHSDGQIEAIAAASSDSNLTVFVKFNSGMNRLGFDIADGMAAIRALKKMPQVAQIVAMTHFARADEFGGIDFQLKSFAPVFAKKNGIKISIRNSAAIFFGDESQCADEWARAGIALYGASPSPPIAAARELNLRPAMTLKTKIIGVRNLKAGDAVGYGGEFVAQSPMRIGIAAVGYGDGYPRSAQKNAQAEINGRRYFLAGRVSMDSIALNFGDEKDSPQVGDDVILWGESPTADEAANSVGTISYELLCGVASRVPRIYR